jgi:hypothetical protein
MKVSKKAIEFLCDNLLRHPTSIHYLMAQQNNELISELLEAKLIKPDTRVMHKGFGFVADQPFGVGCEVPPECEKVIKGEMKTKFEIKSMTYYFSGLFEEVIEKLQAELKECRIEYPDAELRIEQNCYGENDTFYLYGIIPETDEDFLKRQLVTYRAAKIRFQEYLGMQKEFGDKK